MFIEMLNEGKGIGVVQDEALMTILVKELNKELQQYGLSVERMKEYKGYARDSMNLDSIQKIQERGKEFGKDPASMVRVAIFQGSGADSENYVRGSVYNLYTKTCKQFTVDKKGVSTNETTSERGAINNFNLDKSMKTVSGLTVTFLKK